MTQFSAGQRGHLPLPFPSHVVSVRPLSRPAQSAPVATRPCQCNAAPPAFSAPLATTQHGQLRLGVAARSMMGAPANKHPALEALGSFSSPVTSASLRTEAPTKKWATPSQAIRPRGTIDFAQYTGQHSLPARRLDALTLASAQRPPPPRAFYFHLGEDEGDDASYFHFDVSHLLNLPSSIPPARAQTCPTRHLRVRQPQRGWLTNLGLTRLSSPRAT